jgi:putative membrane-bound dehydrogenase-like protein
MTKRYLLGLVLGLPLGLLAADRTPAPLPAEKTAKTMILPEGFRASVFAAEPTVVQPISFCTDARGRLWVAEAIEYGIWKPTGKDRIVILEDRKGTGRADSRKVFYEGFNYITGIEVGFGGVWVVSPPRLWFIPVREGEDKPAGPPRVIFDGFGYKQSRHNLVNGFTWGPDGWLYGGHGRTSPSDVGKPGTPAQQRIHCDGGVYRIHPTRLIFENFADGTTNPWGVDFDDFGQGFVSNCVDPHLFHMIQGGHYEPWRNRPSSQYAYERLPTCADHLHYPSGKPKEMRGETPTTLAMGGGHAHCGTLVYLGDSFPAGYRNTVLMCNIHGRRINRDILHRKGSGYTASHGKDFMISRDPWFMGVTLRTGPDGNIFVSDWSDTGECHTYRPNRDTARIYKISHGAGEKNAVDLTRLADEELVKLQLHRNDWYVRHARRLLQERSAQAGWKGKQVHSALRAMLASTKHETPQRLRALWALHVTGGLDAGRLLVLLEDRSEHVRAWAIQLLCEASAPAEEALTRFRTLAQRDTSPVVRLYLASALQRLPHKQRWGIAEALLKHGEDSQDANLPLMYWYGIEPLVPTDPAHSLHLAVGARVPLVRRFIARRVAEDAAAKSNKGDLKPLVDALREAGEKVRLDLLAGAREGLRGTRSMKMPKGWDGVHDSLSRSENPIMRQHAVVLALIFDDPRALEDLRKTVRMRTASVPARTSALEALIEKRIPDLSSLLYDLLGDKTMRRSALRGLASCTDEKTPKHILARYAELSTEEKQDAVSTLASRKEYALDLLRAVEKKVVPRTDLSAYIARQLHSLGDKQVSDQLRRVWGEVRDTAPEKQKQIARYKSLLTPGFLKKADIRNGRLIFSRTCQQCHRLYGEGNSIGPDLTGSNRANLDYLLSNLVDPSAEVAQDYRMSTVTTLRGRVLTGIVVERSATRVIVQTATERIVLSRKDIETIKDSPLSMMPEGILESLTREQVRDLIAYLAAKTQVPLPAEAPRPPGR